MCKTMDFEHVRPLTSFAFTGKLAFHASKGFRICTVVT